MTITYDEDVDILKIDLVPKEDYKVYDSRKSGKFIFDLNNEGEIIGIEILDSVKTLHTLNQTIYK